MNAFAAIDQLETPLRPVLDHRVYVEPKDSRPSSELQRQAAWVSDMHRYAKRVLVFAVPNGTNIASQWGRTKVKREGLYTGFPDTGATWDGCTAYLEWKSGTGTPDDAQIEALNRLVGFGHPCAIVRTVAGAMIWLRSVGAPVPEVRA